MAVSLSLMCGRLGSVFGSNVVGLLLDDYCDYAFVFSGCTLVFTCCLVFFIPNIAKRSVKDPKTAETVSPS